MEAEDSIKQMKVTDSSYTKAGLPFETDECNCKMRETRGCFVLVFATSCTTFRYGSVLRPLKSLCFTHHSFPLVTFCGSLQENFND